MVLCESVGMSSGSLLRSEEGAGTDPFLAARVSLDDLVDLFVRVCAGPVLPNVLDADEPRAEFLCRLVVFESDQSVRALVGSKLGQLRATYSCSSDRGTYRMVWLDWPAVLDVEQFRDGFNLGEAELFERALDAEEDVQPMARSKTDLPFSLHSLQFGECTG